MIDQLSGLMNTDTERSMLEAQSQINAKALDNAYESILERTRK